MGKTTIKKQIFLENLPKGGERISNNRINWEKSIGCFVKGIYDDIEFEVEIKDYIVKEQRLIITYNDEDFYIKTGNFTRCVFGKILNKITVNFKIEISTRLQDNKRDMTIIDREHRENERVDKNGNTSVAKLKYYKYKCNVCGFEGWIAENALLGQGVGCSCCSGHTVVEGINDIPTVAPWLVKYFKDGYDEAKLYTYNSHTKIYPICPDCGRVKKNKMRIADIYKYASIGCSCSDGVSCPEKFMYNLLYQLNIDFETEYSPTWINNRRYDFYIPSMNLIIEMDGGLGHGKRIHSKDNKTIEETIQIDNYKDEQAKLHGIEVIRIDCNYSTVVDRFEYIKQNTLNNSRLNKLFDLSSVDWEKIEECIYSNFVKIACEYKRNNPELLTGDIAKIMKNSRATVRKYLMCGNKLGWCDYNGKEEHLRSNKINSMNTKKICSIPLICLDNGEVFESATSCSKLSITILGISISQTSISNSCKNKSKTKGYQFKYIKDLTSEEYIKYDIENKLKELHNNELVQAC